MIKSPDDAFPSLVQTVFYCLCRYLVPCTHCTVVRWYQVFSPVHSCDNNVLFDVHMKKKKGTRNTGINMDKNQNCGMFFHCVRCTGSTVLVPGTWYPGTLVQAPVGKSSQKKARI